MDAPLLLRRGLRLRCVPRLPAAPPRPWWQPALPHGALRRVHDAWLPEQWHVVGDQAVVIVDGAFLLRPGLADHWDYVVWLEIDMEALVARAKRRDVAWVGSEQVVEERYRRHWIPTHELYEELAEPRTHAHAVIGNRNLQAPEIHRLSPPTAPGSTGVSRQRFPDG